MLQRAIAPRDFLVSGMGGRTQQLSTTWRGALPFVRASLYMQNMSLPHGDVPVDGSGCQLKCVAWQIVYTHFARKLRQSKCTVLDTFEHTLDCASSL